MKKLTTKVAATCILLASISMSSCGQGYSSGAKDSSQVRAKLDKSKVPKHVTDAFYNQYPLVNYGDWYGYPAFNGGSAWYDYDPNYFLTGDPDNYVIEFNNKDTAFKAIYAKDGTKIASHKGISSDMPAAVTNAIRNGDYKSWTVGKDKEEIFKDKDTDQLKVYKVSVSKGIEKHTLYFQQDGKMLKDVKGA
jgi:hypothetical protein